MIAATTEPSYEPSILLAREAALWADSVEKVLSKAGYRMSVVASVDEAEAAIARHCPDVVITAASSRSLMFYDALRGNPTLNQRPFLVLITADTNVTPDKYAAADIVLPPEPAYIERQLQMFLQLRLDNQRMKQQATTVQEEILGLRTTIEKQNRTVSEVQLLRDAIIQNVSHELRTPLLQVKSAVALIADDVEDKRLISYAENAMARLEALVKNITMLGQSLEINISPIILRDAVEYARRNLGRIWQRKGEAERIKLLIDSDLPPIMADKQGLSTVLQQLLDNALKFSEKNGKDVEVIGKREGDKAYIAVRDYGIGIPEDKLKNIFDLFYQVDSSSTRPYGGLGVGLALVKLILEHHGTKIEVISQLDEGSTFYFYLPIATIEIHH
jgi:signal transduction histidine kinase